MTEQHKRKIMKAGVIFTYYPPKPKGFDEKSVFYGKKFKYVRVGSTHYTCMSIETEKTQSFSFTYDDDAYVLENDYDMYDELEAILIG